jgi:soluble lytic murein transglycosylase-like protein
MLAWLGVTLLCAWPAAAETAVLRNGQRMRITGYEREGDALRLHVPGGSVLLRRDEVAAIEPEDFSTSRVVAPQQRPLAEIVRDAARRHSVDEDLLHSVIAAESNYDPRAVSPRGARGLMQLMPQTAGSFSVSDAFDPEQNIEAGTRYLRRLLALYVNNLRLALAAYNAGPERVAQARGVPRIAETRGYIERVLRRLRERKQAASAGNPSR